MLRKDTHSNDVPPHSPVAKHLLHRLTRQTLPPVALDDECLKQRAQEQRRCQEQRFEGLHHAHGPVPHGMEGVVVLIAAFDDEYGEGGQRGHGTGQADRGDACADDRGRVA